MVVILRWSGCRFKRPHQVITRQERREGFTTRRLCTAWSNRWPAMPEQHQMVSAWGSMRDNCSGFVLVAAAIEGETCCPITDGIDKPHRPNTPHATTNR